jgi:hypothetical protein
LGSVLVSGELTSEKRQGGHGRTKTILEIIEASGRLRDVKSISIQNEPWMRLVIEVLSERGPDGRLVVSVAHYSEQNSDPMRDPEMLFEVMGDDSAGLAFWPFYFRNDYVGLEQWSRYRCPGGDMVCLPSRTRDLEQFASIWDRNLAEQGFLEAFRRQVEHARSTGRSGDHGRF